MFNNEKEVEYFYWSELEKIGKAFDPKFIFSAASKTDGYFEAEYVNDKKERVKIKTLCEIKYDLDFTNNANIARVIIQALYYIKARQQRGLEVPSSVFVGDKDEYFLVSVKQFADILDPSYNNEMDPEWKFAPSSAYKLNTKLYEELYLKDIPLMIKNLEEKKIEQKFVSDRMSALASSENIKTKLNEETIKKPFHYFTQSVLTAGETIKDHMKIKLFFAVITGSEDAIYKKGRIRYEGVDYTVNDNFYAGFVNVYQTKYKASEREKFIASMDSLIKTEARRFHGAFFTPKVVVDYSHEVMDENLSENWRDEYVVWDPAAGTLNLTRDYQFKELYCSTLFQEELDLAADYNPEATKFQFDFLNDEFKAQRDGGKIPDGLYDAVNDKEKKVIILMNAPYGANGGGGANKKSKTNISTHSLTDRMKEDGLGHASQELYTAFIYRVIELFEDKENKTIAQFTKSNFLRTSGMISFIEYYKVRYEIEEMFGFDSGHFEGTVGGWPVVFSISKIKTTAGTVDFKTPVRYVDFIDGKVVKIDGEYNFYIVDKGMKLTTWGRELNKGKELIETEVALSMPNNLKTIKKNRTGKIHKINSLGYFLCDSNTIKEVSTHTSLFSKGYSNGNGFPVDQGNLLKSTSIFSARKLPELTLYNYQDEFLKPDETHKKFEEFKYDSLVYSLFNNTSYQSSLRKVGYDTNGDPINYPTPSKQGNINVYNEWFFLSREEISDLADEHFFEVYQDAKGQKDRYVYNELEKLIQDNKLSKEALDVLEAGRKLFRDTFSMRQNLHIQYPQYHLNAWDAGYWQLRTALKEAGLEHMLNDLKAKYKVLEEKMRPLVYELGFLKK